MSTHCGCMRLFLLGMSTFCEGGEKVHTSEPCLHPCKRLFSRMENTERGKVLGPLLRLPLVFLGLRLSRYALPLPINQPGLRAPRRTRLRAAPIHRAALAQLCPLGGGA
jgi:hypothetical protein